MDIQFGLALLGTFDEDGYLKVQVDADGEQESGVAQYEVHSPFGLRGRPLDGEMDGFGNPQPGRCAQVLTFVEESGIGHVMVLDDPRIVGELPLLNPGETEFYGAFAQFIRCRNDGTLVFRTTMDGTQRGLDVIAELGKNGFIIDAPWGRLVFDNSGFYADHSSAGRIGIEFLGGIPGLEALTSTFSVVAGIADIQAPIFSAGPANKPGDGLVQHTAFAASGALLSVAIQNLTIALASLTGGPVSPASSAAIIAAAANLGTASTEFRAALTGMRTNSAIG